MSKRMMSFIFAYWEIGFFIYFLSFDNFGKLISLILMSIPVAYYNRKKLINIFMDNDCVENNTSMNFEEKEYDDFEEIEIELFVDDKFD